MIFGECRSFGYKVWNNAPKSGRKKTKILVKTYCAYVKLEEETIKLTLSGISDYKRRAAFFSRHY